MPDSVIVTVKTDEVAAYLTRTLESQQALQSAIDESGIGEWVRHPVLAYLINATAAAHMDAVRELQELVDQAEADSGHDTVFHVRRAPAPFGSSPDKQVDELDHSAQAVLHWIQSHTAAPHTRT